MSSMRDGVISLKNLVGKHVFSGIETGQCEKIFYGSPEVVNYIKFTLDGNHYVAFEDPDDGWRSYLSELEIVAEPCKYKIPDTEVACKMSDDSCNVILEFIDICNGKTFLRIGTGDYDDYYPYCLLDYIPENLHWNNTSILCEEE